MEQDLSAISQTVSPSWPLVSPPSLPAILSSLSPFSENSTPPDSSTPSSLCTDSHDPPTPSTTQSLSTPAKQLVQNREEDETVANLEKGDPEKALDKPHQVSEGVGSSEKAGSLLVQTSQITPPTLSITQVDPLQSLSAPEPRYSSSSSERVHPPPRSNPPDLLPELEPLDYDDEDDEISQKSFCLSDWQSGEIPGPDLFRKSLLEIEDPDFPFSDLMHCLKEFIESQTIDKTKKKSWFFSSSGNAEQFLQIAQESLERTDHPFAIFFFISAIVSICKWLKFVDSSRDYFFLAVKSLTAKVKTIFCVDSLQKFEFKGAVDCLNNFHSLPGSFVQKYLIPSLTFLLKKKKVTAATHADFCLQMILLYHVASYLTGNPSQLYTFIKGGPKSYLSLVWLYSKWIDRSQKNFGPISFHFQIVSETLLDLGCFLAVASDLIYSYMAFVEQWWTSQPLEVWGPEDANALRALGALEELQKIASSAAYQTALSTHQRDAICGHFVKNFCNQFRWIFKTKNWPLDSAFKIHEKGIGADATVYLILGPMMKKIIYFLSDQKRNFEEFYGSLNSPIYQDILLQEALGSSVGVKLLSIQMIRKMTMNPNTLIDLLKFLAHSEGFDVAESEFHQEWVEIIKKFLSTPPTLEWNHLRKQRMVEHYLSPISLLIIGVAKKCAPTTPKKAKGANKGDGLRFLKLLPKVFAIPFNCPEYYLTDEWWEPGIAVTTLTNELEGYLVYPLLEAMTKSDRFESQLETFFTEMSKKESIFLRSHTTLPPIYIALAQAFTAIILRLRKKSNQIQELLRTFPKMLNSSKICLHAVLLNRSLCNELHERLTRNRFHPPLGTHLIFPFEDLLRDQKEQSRSELFQVVNSIQESLMDSLLSLVEENGKTLKRSEILFLMEKNVLQNFKDIGYHLTKDLPLKGVTKKTLDLLLVQFQQAREDIVQFGKVRQFLLDRQILPPDFPANFSEFDLESANLMEMELWIDQLKDAFGFSGKTTRALKIFVSGSSNLFIRQFDESIQFIKSNSSLVDGIDSATQTALLRLQNLILSDQATLSSFNEEIKNLVNELSGRSQKTLQRELDLAQKFFRKELMTGPQEIDLQERMRRLEAAVDIVRYREMIKKFILSLKELRLLPEYQINSIELNQIIQGIKSDEISLSKTDEICSDIKNLLGGLSPVGLEIVSSIQPKVLDFLRKKSEGFGKMLDLANTNYIGDDHALLVLNSLGIVQKFLLPFTSGPFENIEKIGKIVMDQCRGIDAVSDVPVSRYLATVTAQLDVIECSYFAFDESSVSSEKILNFIRNLFPNGKYISSLRNSEKGASLAFEYSSLIEDKKASLKFVLSADDLRELVQSAVLRQDSSEDAGNQEKIGHFIRSYESAIQGHDLRLQLEAVGHPHHRKGDIALPVEWAELANLCVQLSSTLESWSQQLDEVRRLAPHLNLLGGRSLLEFVQNLRFRASDNIVDRLLPYVVQCFGAPDILRNRDKVSLNLKKSIEVIKLDEISPKPEESLKALSEMVSSIQESLGVEGLYEDDPSYSAKVWDLSEHTQNFYQIVINNFISEAGRVPLPSELLWCSPTTTSLEVKEWIQRASLPGIVSTLCAIHVNDLTGPVREELLQHLCDQRYAADVTLVFSSNEGLDSFLFLDLLPPPVLGDSLNVTRSFWGLQERNGTPPISRIQFVGGMAGQGKTHWIQAKLSASSPVGTMSVVIHEGYQPLLFIKRYRKLMKELRQKPPSSGGQIPVIGIHIDVTPFANVEELGRFLHHLISLGLLIDEVSGQSFSIDHQFTHHVYIEVPQLLEDDENHKAWPAPESFSVATHPFLNNLPILSLVCHKEDMITITPASYPLVIDENAKTLAHFLILTEKIRVDWSDILQPEPELDEALVAETLYKRWGTKEFEIPNNKLSYSRFISLMADRCSYLKAVAKEFYRQNKANEWQQVRLWAAPDKSLRKYRIQDRRSCFGARFYKNLFNLMLDEVTHLVNQHKKTCDGPRVWVVRPENPNDLCVLVSDCDLETQKEFENKRIFPKDVVKFANSASHNLKDWKVAHFATAFGLRDSSDLPSQLQDLGFIMTPECFVKLLHLHGCRQSRSTLIFEGDTGVGKSELLRLYSFVINLDNSLFTNLKNRFRSLLRGLLEMNEKREEFQSLQELKFPTSTRFKSAELIDFLMNVVRSDLENLLLEMSYAVCERFHQVFLRYPLLLDQASQKVKDKIKEYADIPEQDHLKVAARRAAKSAEEFEFLTGERNEPKKGKMEEEKGGKKEEKEGKEEEEREEEKDQQREGKIVRLFNTEADFKSFLVALLDTQPIRLFDRILAHESLNSYRWREFILAHNEKAKEIQKKCPKATICIFVDELNTANALGMINEVFTRHTLDGIPLCKNLFFVGAINPLERSVKFKKLDFSQLSLPVGTLDQKLPSSNLDDHKPYIVRPLPGSLARSVSRFDSLTSDEEFSFLREFLRNQLPIEKEDLFTQRTILWTILNCHDRVKEFEKLGKEVSRVRVSIRDMKRAVRLYKEIVSFSVPMSSQSSSVRVNPFLPRIGSSYVEYNSENQHHALVVAVCLAYYSRLPSQELSEKSFNKDLRAIFMDTLRAQLGRQSDPLKILKESHNTLWSYMKIPSGLAHTPALKENLYSIIVAVNFGFPLLITGPPGCGKTLSFSLAENNLKGTPSSTCTFVASRLKQIYVHPYQCSQYSSAKEIEAVYKGAKQRQLMLDGSDQGRNVCCVFLDEAGLPKERKQALKATHDVLDERAGISTVMLSNSTLDAAKTNRMIQVIQTQASVEDLKLLGKELLQDAEVMKNSIASRGKLNQLVEGLCQSFENLLKGDILPRKSLQWIHNRDFVYLCRHLRRSMDEAGSLFTKSMLLAALRRNFQTVEPHHFDPLAQEFLRNCFPGPSKIEKIEPETFESLRLSIQDSYPGDPNSVPFRHTLVVDKTDSQSVLDLLMILDPALVASSYPVIISDFADDSSTTRRIEALRQIRVAIERGQTLILVNSESLHTALYDVFNRYYMSVPDSDGENQYLYFANIAIGNVSRRVRVHPNFRVIVHLPFSKLRTTPTPFLNRFSKFQLSVSDVMKEKAAQFALNPPSSFSSIPPEYLKSFFVAVNDGAEDFAETIGGSSTLYGYLKNETVSSLVLNVIEETQEANNISFLPSCPLGLSEETLDDFGLSQSDSEFVFEEPGKRLISNLRDFIRRVNFRTLLLARPEALFSIRNSLPAQYTSEYIDNQEHFSITKLLSRIANDLSPQQGSLDQFHCRKIAIFTRASAELAGLSKKRFLQREIRLLVPGVLSEGRSNPVAKQPAQKGKGEEEESDITEYVDLLNLASYSSGDAVRVALQSFFLTIRPGALSILLLIAESTTTTSSQISFARHEVDQLLSKISSLSEERQKTRILVTFLIPIQSEFLSLRPFYHSVFLNSWDYAYVDSFGGEEDVLKLRRSKVIQPGDPLGWLRVAWGLAKIPTVEDAKAEFKSEIQEAITTAIQKLRFPPRPQHLQKPLQRAGTVYLPNGKKWIEKQLLNRPYIIDAFLVSFVELWGSVLEQTVSQSCHKISRGETTGSVLGMVKSLQKWILTDFFVSVLQTHLLSDFGLEAISSLPEGELNLPEAWLTRTQINEQTLDANQLRGGLLVKAMHAIPPPRLVDVLDLPVILASVPNRTSRASRMPMFNSIMKFLDAFLIQVLNEWGDPREAAKKASFLLFSNVKIDFDKRHTENLNLGRLASCIQTIQQYPALLKDWLADYVSIFLGLPIKSDLEMDVLVAYVLHLARQDAEESSSPILSIRLIHQSTICREGKDILAAIQPLVTVLDPVRIHQIIENPDSVERFQNIIVVEAIRCLGEPFQKMCQNQLSPHERVDNWMSPMRELYQSGPLQSSKKLQEELGDGPHFYTAGLMVLTFLAIGHSKDDQVLNILKVIDGAREKTWDNLWAMLFSVLDQLCIFTKMNHLTEEIVRWGLACGLNGGKALLSLGLTGIRPVEECPLDPCGWKEGTWAALKSLPPTLRKMWLLKYELVSLDNENRHLVENIQSLGSLAHGKPAPIFIPPFVRACQIAGLTPPDQGAGEQKFFDVPALEGALGLVLEALLEKLLSWDEPETLSRLYLSAVQKRELGSPFAMIAAAAYSVRICEIVGSVLADDPNSKLDESVIGVCRTICSEHKTAWGPFLISQIQGIDSRTSFLENMDLLEQFGLSFCFVKKGSLGVDAHGQPVQVVVRRPYLPLMICEADPLFGPYQSLCSLLKDPNLTLALFNKWANRNLDGGVGPYRARGFVLLALYYEFWVHQRGCPVVHQWASHIKQNSAQVEKKNRLDLSEREVAPLLFFSQPPQEQPLLRHERLNVDKNFSWYFSLDSLTAPAQGDREAFEDVRSSFITALVVIIGSPPSRLYYYTPLFCPQIIANGQTYGLGSGHGGLAKDCGYKTFSGVGGVFGDYAPKVPPFGNQTIHRLINNSLIYMAHTWNTLFFDDSAILKSKVFTYWSSDLPFHTPERHLRVCMMIYAFNRGASFYNAFSESYKSLFIPTGEPLYGWGCALQATWDAAIDEQSAPALRSTYPSSLGTQPLLDTMQCLQLRWEGGFQKEQAIREALSKLMGVALGKRLQEIDQVIRKMELVRFPRITMDHFWDYVEKTQSEGGGSQAKILHLLMRERKASLLMNLHIPDILNMYTFVSSEFAYKMTSAQYHETLLPEAIDRLPDLQQRQLGNALLNRFRTAWKEVRQFFETFQQCAQELDAAAAIPALTGDDLKLCNVVTRPDLTSTEVDDCPLIRILNSRLVDSQNVTLDLVHELLTSERESDDFNRFEWVLDRNIEKMQVSHLPRTEAVWGKLLTMGGDQSLSSVEEELCLGHLQLGEDSRTRLFNLNPILRFVCSRFISKRPYLKFDVTAPFLLKEESILKEIEIPEMAADHQLQNEPLSKMDSASRLEFLEEKLRNRLGQHAQNLEKTQEGILKRKLTRSNLDSESLMKDLLELSRLIFEQFECENSEERLAKFIQKPISSFLSQLPRPTSNLENFYGKGRMCQLPTLIRMTTQLVVDRAFKTYLADDLPAGISSDLDSIIEKDKKRALHELRELASEIHSQLNSFQLIRETAPLRTVPVLKRLCDSDPISNRILTREVQIKHLGSLMRLLRARIGRLSEEITIENMAAQVKEAEEKNKALGGESSTIPVYQEKIIKFDIPVPSSKVEGPAEYLEVMKNVTQIPGKQKIFKSEVLRSKEREKEEDTGEEEEEGEEDVSFHVPQYPAALISTERLTLNSQAAESLYDGVLPPITYDDRILFSGATLLKGMSEEDCEYLKQRGILVGETYLKKFKPFKESKDALPSKLSRVSDWASNILKRRGQRENDRSRDEIVSQIKGFISMNQLRVFLIKIEPLHSTEEFILVEDIKGFDSSSGKLDTTQPPISSSGLTSSDLDYLVKRNILKYCESRLQDPRGERKYILKEMWIALSNLCTTIPAFANTEREKRRIPVDRSEETKKIEKEIEVFIKAQKIRTFKLNLVSTGPEIQDSFLKQDMAKFSGAPLKKLNPEKAPIANSGLTPQDLDWLVERNFLECSILSLKGKQMKRILERSWFDLADAFCTYEEFAHSSNSVLPATIQNIQNYVRDKKVRVFKFKKNGENSEPSEVVLKVDLKDFKSQPREGVKQLLDPKRDERIKKSGLTQENLEFLIKRGALERCFPLRNKKVWRIELKNWEALPEKVMSVRQFLVARGLKGNEPTIDGLETFSFRLSDASECEPFALIEDLDGYNIVGAAPSPQETFCLQMDISEKDFDYLIRYDVFALISEDGKIQWDFEVAESVVLNALLSLKELGEKLSFEVDELLEDFQEDEELKVVSVRGELYVIKSVLIRERPGYYEVE